MARQTHFPWDTKAYWCKLNKGGPGEYVVVFDLVPCLNGSR